MTGSTGTQEMTGPTGMPPDLESYGAMMRALEPTGPTGPDPSVLAMFPSAVTGPAEAPTIVTMEELMASHAAIIAKEVTDSHLLLLRVSPTRDAFRPQLFQWASAGFPDLYVVKSISITPPAVCTDGVTREIGKYVEYRIGKNLGEVIDGLKTLMTGIQPSWSIDGNTLRIHVTKAPATTGSV